MDVFLKESGLAADTGRALEYIEGFEAEMLKGLRGEPGSLRMLPTRIDPCAIADSDLAGRVIAIDAGGTNLRVALVELREDGAPEILHHEKYPVPGSDGGVGVDEFFDKIASCLGPVAAKSDRIAFCFSNPAETLPSGDARVIGFTKEVKVSGSSGVVIGDALREALKSRGLPSEKSVVVLNDAVAAQLAALADAGERGQYGSSIGFIFGTGVNVCYAEKNGNVVKDEALRAAPGSTIINVEAGGYDGFPEGEADRRHIAATDDPEKQRFEKMSSGAYQCDNLLEWIRLAASKGVFSEGFEVRAGALKRIPVGEPERFCVSPRAGGELSKLCVNAADAAKLRRLTEAFFDRIAFMLAVMLTAVLSRAGDAARDASRPVRVSAEGSALAAESVLRERLAGYMSDYARGRLGLHSRFVQIEHATLIGAAVAGLGHPKVSMC
jgi:hexokinase